MEEWRSIPSYEGIYEVSSWGRVRSVDRVVQSSNMHTSFCYTKKGQMLNQQSNNKGYLILQLRNEYGRCTMPVHRLVAEAFIPNPDNLSDVNHKDGNKANNHVENLEWMSHFDNVHHSVEELKRGGCIKKRREVVMLKDGKVVAKFASVSEAARSIGCSLTYASKVVNGRAAHVKGFQLK